MSSQAMADDALMDVTVETRCDVQFVPLRPVAHALGGDFRWNNDTMTAVATVGDACAVFSIAASHADISGRVVSFSAPSFVEHGEVYVPLSFIESAFGREVAVEPGRVSLIAPG